MTADDSISKMLVRELSHDRPSGQFSKLRGLSASISLLSSPPPPRSFTCAILRAVFDSHSLLLNCTETLAMQARNRLTDLKRMEECVRVRIFQKHELIVINDILARYSS